MGIGPSTLEKGGGDVSFPDEDLKVLAEKIRRQPKLAQEMDVSVLVQQLTGRWRQSANMLGISEEVPVAAWIVRRKVEGLIRPDDDEVEPQPYNLDLRAIWLSEAVERLTMMKTMADRFWSRPSGVPQRLAPAPVKEPSLWKLAWSYPRLLAKPKAAVQTVGRSEVTLANLMRDLLHRLDRRRTMVLHDELKDQSREKWAGTFLAAVHLWHQQIVDLYQGEAYAPLVIEKPDKNEANYES